MISILIDAAFRSLIVGLIVWAAMQIFRIRNVIARKTALGLVLVGALAMPLLMQVTDRFGLLPAKASIVLPAHAMTLLEELQAKIQAKSGSNTIPKTLAEPLPGPRAPQAEKPSEPSARGASVPRARNSYSRIAAAPPQKEPAISTAVKEKRAQTIALSPARSGISPSVIAFSIYLSLAALLVLRLSLGIAITLRLWFTAVPILTQSLFAVPAGLRLRASDRISSPLTIGSAVLLPADFASWDEEKLRVVLAHERSHIRQGDFYLQLLAGVYAALVWFSPLGWWLKRELADLAEAISDRAGIEEAPSRTSYAQILLEFAAAPRPTALGVAMARPGSLSRRIEHLLNEQAFRQSFAGSRRMLFAYVLVPAALFAGTAMVRVHAAAQSVHVAWIAPGVSQAAPVRVAQDSTSDATEPFDLKIDEPDTSRISSGPDASAEEAATPEPEQAAIANPEIAAAQTAPNLLAVPAVPRVVGRQEESGSSKTFDRAISVSGEAQLFVATGSGNIHVTRGSGSQIRIHGKIHVSWTGSEDRAKQIAANPPIEQNGNVIRVGQQHEEHWRGISIDYEIEAPTETVLVATSGSGDIVDDGVGKNAKLETGSGDIRAKSLNGPFELQTGSGNITAEQTGAGDAKVQTGSGDIEIKNIHGGFAAQTGSGDIKATGTPSAPWTLKTGSGNVEIWPGNAPLTLNASTGSGSVTTDHEMLVKGSLDHHHISGNLNGGGPVVRVETGSGDVRVH